MRKISIRVDVMLVTRWWWAWRSNSRPSQSTSSPRTWRTPSRRRRSSGSTKRTRRKWDWSRWLRYVCSQAPASLVWSPRTRICSAARRYSGTWLGPAVCPPSRRTWWTACRILCSASSARNLQQMQNVSGD